MANPLDLVTDQQAFEFLDQEPDGGEVTRLVQLFVTGASLAIDSHRGPIVTRSIGALAAGSTPHVNLADTVTGQELAGLYDRIRTRCSVGTAEDPWAVLPVTRITGLDLSTRIVRFQCGHGQVIPEGSAMYVGRHLADNLPESVQMACLLTIRNRWQFEVAAVSQTYDNPAAGGTPWVIPMAALNLLADYPPATA